MEAFVCRVQRKLTLITVIMYVKVEEHGYVIKCQSTLCPAVLERAHKKVDEMNFPITAVEQQLHDQMLHQQRFTIADIKDSDSNVSTAIITIISCCLQLSVQCMWHAGQEPWCAWCIPTCRRSNWHLAKITVLDCKLYCPIRTG